MSRKADIYQIEPMAFQPGSKVDLFIGSLPLMTDEDFTAFRVYAQNSKGQLYRFPTTGLRMSDFNKEVYVLSITLLDELGFWDQPAATGDLIVQVTWRGMASNAMRLGFGKLGGTFGIEPPVYSRSLPAKSAAKDSVSPTFVGYKWSGDRMRFLEQATFGPTAALDSRIRRIGLRTWLAEQFDLPYPSVSNPYPNQPLKPASPPSDCDGDAAVPDVPTTCFRDTYTMYPLQSWFFREAMYGDAQLRHRVAWALSQVWVTSGNDIQQSRHMVEYYKILAKKPLATTGI